MYANRTPYFLDNSLNDVKKAAQELSQINPKIAHELLMDYKEGTLDEAGGLLFTAKRTGPKYTQTGNLKKGSDRITFSRNSFDDLSLNDKINVLRDNIAGYTALIKSTNIPESQLSNYLKPHNPNELIYNDIIDILAESADSKTAIYQGPGQVGSPGRGGSKQFNKLEALKNAAQFLTEGPTDRLLGTHVSFPQQGHVLDAKNNPLLARDITNMRAQQGEPNRRDGADARGLVNLTRKENLEIGKSNDINKLLEFIDDRLGQNISDTETINLINLAMEIQGKPRYAGDAIRAIVGGSGRTDSPGANRERALVIDSGGGDVIIGESVLRSNGKNGNGNRKH